MRRTPTPKVACRCSGVSTSGGRARGDDAAGAQQDHAIGGRGAIEIVGRQHHRDLRRATDPAAASSAARRAGSRWLVGSSSSSSAGSATSARASAARWASPPDKRGHRTVGQRLQLHPRQRGVDQRALGRARRRGRGPGPSVHSSRTVNGPGRLVLEQHAQLAHARRARRQRARRPRSAGRPAVDRGRRTRAATWSCPSRWRRPAPRVRRGRSAARLRAAPRWPPRPTARPVALRTAPMGSSCAAARGKMVRPGRRSASPTGTSRGAKAERARVSAPDQQGGAEQRRGGHQVAVARADQPADRVRRHQADKADEARGRRPRWRSATTARTSKSGAEAAAHRPPAWRRRRRPAAADPCARLRRRMNSQALSSSTAGSSQRARRRGAQAAEQPEGHRTQQALGGRQHQHQAGGAGQHRSDRDPGQDQARGIVAGPAPPAAAPTRWPGWRPARRPGPGGQAGRQRQRDHRARRGAAGQTEHVRIGQIVVQHGLHRDPGQGQRRADDRAQRDPRRAQHRHHLVARPADPAARSTRKPDEPAASPSSSASARAPASRAHTASGAGPIPSRGASPLAPPPRAPGATGHRRCGCRPALRPAASPRSGSAASDGILRSCARLAATSPWPDMS